MNRLELRSGEGGRGPYLSHAIEGGMVSKFKRRPPKRSITRMIMEAIKVAAKPKESVEETG